VAKLSGSIHIQNNISTNDLNHRSIMVVSLLPCELDNLGTMIVMHVSPSNGSDRVGVATQAMNKFPFLSQA
jgi:hypothetical protein